jgi:hypothetical protein
MKLTVQTHDIEVEKPSGGGKGPKALYIVEVLIDGRLALTLHRHNFKETGQMADFVAIINTEE